MAAGFVLGALGTDTGGSIRLPAACCGVVGLKPTYGLVSRAGVMPLSWSLDHVGPIARTVQDAALLLNTIAGHDRADPTSLRRPIPDYLGRLHESITGLRVAVPENYFFDRIDGEIASAVQTALDVVRECGAQVVPAKLPYVEDMMRIANVISRCESAAVHTRIAREHPADLQPAVRKRLELGFKISAHDYLQATRLRARLTSDFVKDVFPRFDVLLTPVIVEFPPEANAVAAMDPDAVVARMRDFSRCTRPFNGFGFPALSVPCGFSQAGLPVAYQIVGRPFEEATILRVGNAYERATQWSQRRPALSFS